MTTDRGTIWLCSQRTLGSLPARVSDEVASGAIHAEALISARLTIQVPLMFRPSLQCIHWNRLPIAVVAPRGQVI